MKFWRQHWWSDPLLGLLVAGIVYRCNHHGLLHSGDAASLYLAVVTASAALGTLAITPIAIVLALTPGPRLRAIMHHQVDVIRRAMGWTVFANLLAVLTGLLGIILDSSVHADHLIRVLALAAESEALLAMARLVWFFLALLRAEDIDRTVDPT